MNYPRYLIVALLGWLTLGFIQAQTTATPPAAPALQPAATPSAEAAADETVALSPFVVTADDTNGYQATSTLAGTRLRTDLRNLPASISVVTPEFMQDTGSTNAADLLVYTLGTEVRGVGGNFNGDTATANSGRLNNTTANLIGANPGTRVRGLAGADTTRDFFGTSIPFDSYNLDRVDINRGANGALFGLGSPAGIINYSPNRALHRNSVEIGYRTDNFGSARASINVNRSLIENVLGVRLAALRDNKDFEQDPAFENQTRYFAAMEFKPFKTTTLRASFENVDFDANRPRAVPVHDFLSYWWVAQKPTVSFPTGTGAGGSGIPDPSRVAGGSGATASPVLVYTQHDSPTLGIDTRLGRVDSLLLQGGSNFLFRSAQNERDSIRTNPSANVPNPMFSDPVRGRFWLTPTLRDRSVFDYRKNLIDGPNKFEKNEADVYNVTLEQLFFDGKAGIELAVQNEVGRDARYDPLRNDRSELRLDVNVTNIDGTPNPNFGRPFLLTEGQTSVFTREFDNKRATAFIRHNFEDTTDGWIGKVLGAHTLTGVYSENRHDASRPLNSFPFLTGKDWQGKGLVYNDSINNAGARGITVLQYLGPSLAGLDSAAGANIPGVTVRRDFPNSFAGQTLSIYSPSISNDPSSYRIAQYTAHSFLPGDGNKYLSAVFNQDLTARTVDSKVVNLQSGWFQGVLQTLVSWREDEVKSFQFAGPRPQLPLSDPLGNAFNADPSVLQLRETPTLHVTNDTLTWGVVLHAPGWLTDKLPGDIKLSGFYNTAENVRPAGARFNIFNEAIALPGGETEDIGFALSMFDNKLNIRATWYETSQARENGPINLFTTGDLELAFRKAIDRMVEEINDPLTSPGDLAIRQQQLAIAQQSYVRPGAGTMSALTLFPETVAGVETVADQSPISRAIITTDFVSKGLEIEATYNPTRNWRIFMAIAQQESIRSNTGVDLGEYYASRQAMWDGPVGSIYTGTIGGQTFQQRNASLQQSYLTQVLQDGRPAQELREWRVNMTTNYAFTQGFMKGWNVGGSYRWEDKGAAGFPFIFDAAINDYRSEVENPWYSPTTSYVDAFFGYTTKIADGKIVWNIQLNIRNLLDADDDIPVGIQPDGTVGQIRIANGRTWALSSSLKF